MILKQKSSACKVGRSPLQAKQVGSDAMASTPAGANSSAFELTMRSAYVSRNASPESFQLPLYVHVAQRVMSPLTYIGR